MAKSGGASFAPDMDFTKFFADMKLPALPNMETFMAANRKNIETFSAANRIALEGAQAVGRRQMEMVQSSMAESGRGDDRRSPRPPHRRTRQRSRRNC